MATRRPRSSARRPSSRSARPGKPLGSFPEERLHTLARDLWWTWSPTGRRVFEALDPPLWRATNHNPFKTISHLSAERRRTIAGDTNFARALAQAEADHADYHRTRPWYARTATGKQKRMHIAYFCMEYGLHEHLPLYSGGLGILAADHLKSASDLGIPLTAIGMLWREGYYRQELETDGSTRVVYERYEWDDLPIVDTGASITVRIGRADVIAKIWCLQVGRVPLYLLDCDHEANPPKARELTRRLYSGDNEHRIRQEVLLGVGGYLAMQELGIEPTVLHLNEGHAAFAPLEELAQQVEAGYSYDEAVEIVRAGSVFTTHTPVPAGNDRFDPKLFNKYMRSYGERLGLTNRQLLALGREDETDTTESFCMTVLALKLAEHCNGVAELHGETSRTMWMKTFDATTPDEVPIGHVTNGIHVETWLSDDARPFYDRHFKPKWNGAGPEDDWWKNARSIPPREIWALRNRLRRKFVSELRTRMRDQYQYHTMDPSNIIDLYEQLDENALTIGFARRFATYKRAILMFHDEARLARLLHNPKCPVQIVFSGKAHPRDLDGQEFVRRVWKFSQKPAFKGKVFFVQNYDCAVGRMLTSGVDLWLNNPIRPMEASGTSGMKPPLNAGLNCSILDGWWPEGYNGRNGWTIGGEQFRSERAQLRYDADALYEVLETEVVPCFYDRGRDGVPRRWCSMIGESWRSICAEFSTHRMLRDYCERSYWPAHESS
ncbi:MAG: alpha-glucan family phosphorylase [Planctomycetota bacterium]